MNVKPIRTKRDYGAALRRAEQLMQARQGSADADELEVLSLLIESYEAKHFPIDDPDPISLLEHVMEAQGLARRDLEPFIGSRARVAEVLNRVRPLTLEMIRRLTDGLKLPADVLVRPYPLRRAA
jgi:HTH-type transcriptional regulator / antitoxin HigA